MATYLLSEIFGSVLVPRAYCFVLVLILLGRRRNYWHVSCRTASQNQMHLQNLRMSNGAVNNRRSQGVHMLQCVNMRMYIFKEREREVQRFDRFNLSVATFMNLRHGGWDVYRKIVQRRATCVQTQDKETKK